MNPSPSNLQALQINFLNYLLSTVFSHLWVEKYTDHRTLQVRTQKRKHSAATEGMCGFYEEPKTRRLKAQCLQIVAREPQSPDHLWASVWFSCKRLHPLATQNSLTAYWTIQLWFKGKSAICWIICRSLVQHNSFSGKSPISGPSIPQHESWQNHVGKSRVYCDLHISVKTPAANTMICDNLTAFICKKSKFLEHKVSM